jgi:uncharacterized UBP type Zn finger protein
MLHPGSVEKDCSQEDCGSKYCTVTTSFYGLPDLVIIHLNRFNNNGEKVEALVDFPTEVLSLIDDDRTKKYHLFATVNHLGCSTKSGHYTTYCRSTTGNKDL